MFPVDPRLGSDFARGARQWLQYIPTRYFAPMHFPPARERAMTFGPEAERMQTRFLYIQEEGEAIARFWRGLHIRKKRLTFENKKQKYSKFTAYEIYLMECQRPESLLWKRI